MKELIDYNKDELIKFFKQLPKKEQKDFFEEFKDEILSFLREKNYTNRLTIEEYENRINEAEIAYSSGDFLTQKELEDEIDSWE